MFELLTTFHKAGWEQYGRRMVETFLAHWPSNIKLNVYCENVDVNLNNPRIIEHDIFKTCDKLRPFIDLYNSREANGYRNGVRDFKYDAIKFSYKVFAQCHSIRNSASDKLIFIDADTLTFASPPLHLIDRLLPETDLTAYLGRPKNNKLPFVTGKLAISKDKFCLLISFIISEYKPSDISIEVFANLCILLEIL